MELICKYFLWLIFYSIVGWVYETILCSVSQRKLVKRGFLNGPYCPIYGFGAVIDLLALNWVIKLNVNTGVKTVILFFAGVILTGVLEYFTSWAMEKLFHAKWWDYSYMRFNINGRVCLAGAVVFGVMSVLLLQIIHPLVAGVTDKIADKYIYIAAGVIFVLIVTDLVFTVIHTVKFNKKLAKAYAMLEEKLNEKIIETKQAADELKKRVTDKVTDAVEDIKAAPQQLYTHAEETKKRIEEKLQAIKDLPVSEQLKMLSQNLSAHDKRTLRAFPAFKSTYYTGAAEKLKEVLHNKITKNKQTKTDNTNK